MLFKQEIQKFSKWELSFLMAIFGNNAITDPENLIFLKKKCFLLTLKKHYDNLPKDKFNRYKVLIKSIFDKIGVDGYDS